MHTQGECIYRDVYVCIYICFIVKMQNTLNLISLVETSFGNIYINIYIHAYIYKQKYI